MKCKSDALVTVVISGMKQLGTYAVLAVVCQRVAVSTLAVVTNVREDTLMLASASVSLMTWVH